MSCEKVFVLAGLLIVLIVGLLLLLATLFLSKSDETYFGIKKKRKKR